MSKIFFMDSGCNFKPFSILTSSKNVPFILPAATSFSHVNKLTVFPELKCFCSTTIFVTVSWKLSIDTYVFVLSARLKRVVWLKCDCLEFSFGKNSRFPIRRTQLRNRCLREEGEGEKENEPPSSRFLPPSSFPRKLTDSELWRRSRWEYQDRHKFQVHCPQTI